MRTKTRMMTLYLLPEEREAVRARAAKCGGTVSAYLRAEALRPPRRLPVRKRIVGVPAMNEAGAMLGHALRGEEGRTPADAWSLAQALHGHIMALKVETTTEPPAARKGKLGNAGNQRSLPPEQHMQPVQFLASPEEEDVMKRLAGAYGLPVSAYIRNRALGRPMQPARQPVEGMSAVRKCLALLGHVAWTGVAPAAEGLYRDAQRKCLTLEGETAS